MPSAPNRGFLRRISLRRFDALGELPSGTRRCGTERIDIGDLVETKRFRRPFGQRHALTGSVIEEDEDGSWKRYDSRPPHTVRGRNASEQQFHLRRLFARGQQRLRESIHELQQDVRVDRRGVGVRCVERAVFMLTISIRILRFLRCVGGTGRRRRWGY